MRTSEPAQRADRDPLPGTVVNGKYRVVSVLARGGMGKIYRAEQVPLGRPVALKVLRTRYADDEPDDPQFMKRFFLEASILSKLQHGNIVTLYDYGRIEGVEGEQYFMAMEYLAGDTLAQRLRRVGALHPRDATRIVRGIARGLREAHRLGIVHRDLKPANIMLVPEEDGGEVVKILDFGIGKMLEADAQQELTAEGAFLGSPRYMAPEQISEGRADARTDLYSLGVMMYECLCGRIPFEGDTNINTMMAHCNNPLPPMRARSPDVTVPESLEALTRNLLEKDPGMRPQNMEAFVRELGRCEEALFGGSPSATSSYPAHARASSPPPAPSPDAPGTAGSFDDPRPSSNGEPPTGTHGSLTRSHFPSRAPPIAEKRRSKGLFVVVGLLLLGASAVVIFFVMPRGASPTPPAAVELGAPSAPAPAAAPAAAPSAYTLQVQSTPAGAEVVEGGNVIGNTPLSFAIDRASVRGGSRTFVVRQEGYEPFTFSRGDSESNETVEAKLVARAPPPTSSAAAVATEKPIAARRWMPPPVATTAAPAPVPFTRPEPDIKLKR